MCRYTQPLRTGEPMTVPDFYHDALCAQVDTELFFPDKGGAPSPAKDICAACPVITQCRDYALADPSLWGVWGGTTTVDRQRIRAGRKAAS